YKLKSVAHLPWRMLTYKALNTFIDDLFAFVIKMPVMYRIGCLRDGPAGCGRASPTSHYLPPLSRCGFLHLPLPTVDLPRRPHPSQRVWHEWRRPHSCCPRGRGSHSSRGPHAHTCTHHDHRRQGGGLHVPAHQAHPGGQLCQRAPGSPSKASRGQEKGLVATGPRLLRLLATTTPAPRPPRLSSLLPFPWTDQAGAAGGPPQVRAQRVT
ncbi:CLPTM1 isoform 12, partial [Pongo abelii]